MYQLEQVALSLRERSAARHQLDSVALSLRERNAPSRRPLAEREGYRIPFASRLHSAVIERVSVWITVALFLLGIGTPASAQDLPAKAAELRAGMTADEVSRHLNKKEPERIVRQILYRRHQEQWFYDNGNIRLEFECQPNKQLRLMRIFQLRNPQAP